MCSKFVFVKIFLCISKSFPRKWLGEAAGDEFSSGEGRREEMSFFSSPGGGDGGEVLERSFFSSPGEGRR